VPAAQDFAGVHPEPEPLSSLKTIFYGSWLEKMRTGDRAKLFVFNVIYLKY
jgi:hypothetical protein